MNKKHAKKVPETDQKKTSPTVSEEPVRPDKNTPSIEALENELQEAEHPLDFLKILGKEISMFSVRVKTGDVITEEQYLELMSTPGQRITVPSWGKQQEWTGELIVHGWQIVESYKKCVDDWVNHPEKGYSEKYNLLSDLVQSCRESYESYYITKRYRFVINTPFFYVEVGNPFRPELKPIPFSKLTFSPELYQQLLEMYEVRYELYQSLHHYAVHELRKLDALRYQTASYQMNERGAYLLLEFVKGMQTAGDYLPEMDTTQTDLLLKNLFDFFGQDPSRVSRYKSYYQQRKDPAEHLERMVTALRKSTKKV